MKESELSRQKLADRLIEDITQINKITLEEGAAICQICGSQRREGDPVTAYAFRPAGTPTFRLGFVTCTDCSPITRFTLGVRELVVEGRIGTCTDVATQSSWPVFLAPAPRVVSPAHTTRGFPVANVDTEDDDVDTNWEAPAEQPRACADGGTN